MRVVVDGGFCFLEAPWLTWADVRYGLHKSFLSTQGVVDYALFTLSEGSVPEHYELACAKGDDTVTVQQCLSRLSADVDLDDPLLLKIWLFLVLLWVFKNRINYSDPLRVLEGFYADFGYPEIVESAVRYMPAADGGSGSDDALFENWLGILESLREELRAIRPS